mmetsp:Transcript_30481/g.73031  ORF Transcript_30481/g.73031 Transcript_30481/m.73031 type:complete len:265 (+) Transcript_30481:61-855(+)
MQKECGSREASEVQAHNWLRQDLEIDPSAPRRLPVRVVEIPVRHGNWTSHGESPLLSEGIRWRGLPPLAQRRRGNFRDIVVHCLLLEQQCKIDAVKPRMSQNIFSGRRPQALHGVLVKQPPHEVRGSAGESRRKRQRCTADGTEHRFLVGPQEWRTPDEHLINQDPQPPNVHQMRMALLLDHLWSQIHRRPAKRLGVVHVALLGQPEIREQRVAPGVQDNVFGLDVTVKNHARMQMGESQCYLSRIDARQPLGQKYLFGEKPRQ